MAEPGVSIEFGWFIVSTSPLISGTHRRCHSKISFPFLTARLYRDHTTTNWPLRGTTCCVCCVCMHASDGGCPYLTAAHIRIFPANFKNPSRGQRNVVRIPYGGARLYIAKIATTNRHNVRVLPGGYSFLTTCSSYRATGNPVRSLKAGRFRFQRPPPIEKRSTACYRSTARNTQDGTPPATKFETNLLDNPGSANATRCEHLIGIGPKPQLSLWALPH